MEGESGAPLAEGESEQCRRLLPEILPLLSEKAKKVIARQGVCYIDPAGEEVTSLVDGRDCVFTTYDSQGRCLCAFEKLYREGRSDFPKPISCHLYPIRVHKTPLMTALNYDRWSICRGAEAHGKAAGLRMYQALKEPIVRAFGQDFYDQLEAARQLLDEQK